MTTWKAKLETADGCWSELDSNAGNPDCKFNALNMLFSVSTGVWERGVESLNNYVSMLSYIFKLWAISPLFHLSFLNVPGETSKEEIGHASATRHSLLAHPSKFEEKQETPRSLLNILS